MSAKSKVQKSMRAARNRVKNIQADVPDSRDWLYQPALIKLPPAMGIPDDLHILDQGYEGACTGFSIAGVINTLNIRRDNPEKVSARMLYEMAKRHDEWPGEDYDGSSLRGAIHGWKNMGVCSESAWPYRATSPSYLTIKRAKDARRNTIGAYYRVRPNIADFHAALNETGAIAVSALVHKGWDNPVNGLIKFRKTNNGGHAFTIVGYNKEGFWIQNSWGSGWGDNGIALWTYEDWIKNVMDAWVFRLALPTPQIFGLKPESSSLVNESDATEKKKPTVDRATIAGHFVHVDDGHFHDSGRYWSNEKDVAQTAGHVATSPDYKHLLIYAHGGLNSPKDSARRIAAMKDGFKRNGIYPYHIMYDTGLAEELKDLIFRKGKVSDGRVGGFSDLSDRFLEGLLRLPGTLVWNEMKADAEDAFKTQGAGKVSLDLFIDHLRKASAINKKIHLAGHSTGAILLGHLLKSMSRTNIKVESCSLMAPACRVDLYNSHYLPVLQGKTKVKLKELQIFNLRNELEKDDNVAKAYRKSLLYLVSNAFEPSRGYPLLGMERFVSQVTRAKGMPLFRYSNGTSGNVTRSKSHGGFDNDPFTMNYILKTILGKAATKPFTKRELKF
ncbi:MAG: peptidase C1 [Gammaproteobacteria bacterium]|nr:peptidase C1 [Gammaproteobacteria bacterium]